MTCRPRGPVRTSPALAVAVVASLLIGAAPAHAEPAPFLPDSIVHALADELSGEAALRNLEALSRQHRMRGSEGFGNAATHIVETLHGYGFTDARITRFPADGVRFYGTQKSRPPWDAEFAELWELRERDGAWVREHRLASWEAMPLSLAQDSEKGEATADLVDVGAGTAESDYAGKDVRGRIVLASSQPGPVARLAVERHGAAGIVSYAQNQRTAWWGENENLVRWGHLDTFAAKHAFAFMVSLKQAREFQRRLKAGERIRLSAIVRAGKHSGAYQIVEATIPGADPLLRREEIVFTCHLDHPRPGANDNASGAAAILEVARTLQKLIREGRIPPPARTLRFVWPPEIEGTLALLNGRPELPPRIKATIHMDMVGGGPETKAIFHVTRGPASLPSFVYDVAEAFGEYVNRQTAAFASGRGFDLSLHSPEGGKEAALADLAEHTGGSDHDVYCEGSFRIPTIYLNDWPDRYIHTNGDVAANIDPTKLERAAFIGAACGYFLARVGAADAAALVRNHWSRALIRAATMLRRAGQISPEEAGHLRRFHLGYERAVLGSYGRLLELPAPARTEAISFLADLERLVGDPGPPPMASGDGAVVFHRNGAIRGPMGAFGYDYLEDHLGRAAADSLRLPRHQGLRGSGGDYAYEVLNLVDGRRTVQAIRDDVSAIYGPVPLELVVEYARALETIGVIRRRP
jgi:aminopeptidase YwaD